MQRTTASSLLWTYGALALALAFIFVSLRLVARIGHMQKSVDAGASAILELQSARDHVREIERAGCEVPEGPERIGDAEARALLDEPVRGYFALWPALADLGRRLDVDVSASLATANDRMNELGEGIPALVAARDDPAAQRREERRLRGLANEAIDALQCAMKTIRDRQGSVANEMKGTFRDVRLVLYLAIPLALLVALLVGLHQRDLRRLVEIQQEKLASDERLELLLDHAPAALWSTDAKLRITFSHGAALSDLGLKPGQLVGMTIEEYLGTTDPDFVPLHSHRRALAGETVDYEFSWKGREFVTGVAPLQNNQGTIVGTLGVALDVTALKAAEKALVTSEERVRQLQKMEAIGRLAGAVAHDFNNYLTVVLGYAGFVLDRLGNDHPLRGELEEIVRTSERATDLTRRLLALSRRQTLRPRPIDLNAVIEAMAPVVRRACGETIELRIELEPALPSIQGDPAQLEQVLLNLALNARDAMATGGRLVLRTATVAPAQEQGAEEAEEAAMGRVLLTVADSGIGMEPSVVSHIFEPFFTTKATGQGTGLGLSIVYGIVQQCGGTITVDSQPGAGTTFSLSFPAMPARSAATTEEDAGKLPRGTTDGRSGTNSERSPQRGFETVLLVEDDDAVRMLARRALEADGYGVIDASSGPEALVLARLHSGSIALLLTDRRMPRMSGLELARELQRARPSLKVLVMSAHPSAGAVEELGADDELPFLQKPFTSGELLRRVRETLDDVAASAS